MATFLIATRNLNRFAALRHRSRTSYHFFTWRRRILDAGLLPVAATSAPTHATTFARRAKHAKEMLNQVLGRLIHQRKFAAFAQWRDVASRLREMEVLLETTRLVFRRALSDEQRRADAFNRWCAGAALKRKERAITIVSIMAHRRRCRRSFVSFRDWISYVARRRLVRGTLHNIMSMYARIVMRVGWERWRDFTRRTSALARRRLRDALAQWTQGCQLRVLRSWRAHAISVGHTRLRAIRFWRKRSVHRVFATWLESVALAKRVRMERRALLSRVARAWRQRKVSDYFLTWAEFRPKPESLHPLLENRLRDADSMRRSHNVDTMRVSSLWREYHAPLQGGSGETPVAPLSEAGDSSSRTNSAQMILRYRAEVAKEVAISAAEARAEQRTRERSGVDDYSALRPPPPPRKVGEYTWEYYQYLIEQDKGKRSVPVEGGLGLAPMRNARTPSRR